MATLIAHGSEPTARNFAQRLGRLMADLQGITTAVEEFSLASRYIDNVESIVVVAEAQDETFHRGASNFMAAQYAETAEKSLFVAALGDDAALTVTQRGAIDAYEPREMSYFRIDQVDDDAMKRWVGHLATRGVS